MAARWGTSLRSRVTYRAAPASGCSSISRPSMRFDALTTLQISSMHLAAIAVLARLLAAEIVAAVRCDQDPVAPRQCSARPRLLHLVPALLAPGADPDGRVGE